MNLNNMIDVLVIAPFIVYILAMGVSIVHKWDVIDLMLADKNQCQLIWNDRNTSTLFKFSLFGLSFIYVYVRLYLLLQGYGAHGVALYGFIAVSVIFSYFILYLHTLCIPLYRVYRARFNQ